MVNAPSLTALAAVFTPSDFACDPGRTTLYYAATRSDLPVFTPYRLSYLGISAFVAASVAFVSGALEPEERAPEISPGLRSVQESQDRLAAPAAVPNDGTEKGNLKEVGAHEILSVGDYERAVALSRQQPVFIFKHSTECEVSGAAYRRMSEWMKGKDSAAPAVFLVKVIERKPVSQAIASRTGVKHESPQMILLGNAKPVWNASHKAITAEAVRAALDALTKHDTNPE